MNLIRIKIDCIQFLQKLLMSISTRIATLACEIINKYVELRTGLHLNIDVTHNHIINFAEEIYDSFITPFDDGESIYINSTNHQNIVYNRIYKILIEYCPTFHHSDYDDTCQIYTEKCMNLYNQFPKIKKINLSL